MGTPFTEIYEIFRTITEDYKLDNIYVEDQDAFKEILKSFLTTALPEFIDCLQSLEYEAVVEDEKTNYYFIETLTSDVKMILSKIMTEKWFLRDVQDLTALQSSLGKREFSKDPRAEVLRRKSDYRDNLISEYQADIKNYYFRHLEELAGWGV